MLDEKIDFMPLGAGSEVGRSCMYFKYQSSEILMDIGIHPAYTGPCALPFLDLIDLSKIDALFVTHFHLDHAGALPYITERTNFKGKVYMTHPTKAILRYLLNDYTRIVNASSDSDFYSEKDLENCYNKIIAVDYHQEIICKDFKVQALNAGHVLGAAMFLINVRNTTLLYTGDYSTEEDRHLKPAESPGKVNTLIVESTYGVQCHLPRLERERRFTNTIKNVILRGGKVLLPVFALGRAQELLLILEEFWENNKELRNVPIYYASALAKRCIGIYQTYSSSNKKVNFYFKYITNISYYEESPNPCVVMASPGMLQSGLSRELFENWCENPKNGVIIAGYCVNGTLAKDIMNEPEEIETIRGEKLKLKCSIDYISFSAHVDFLQNAHFINECNPENLFLVHGEVNEMNRLKNALKRENIYCLKNGELQEIIIIREKIIRMKNIALNEEFEAIIKGKDDYLEVIEKINLPQLSIKQRVTLKDTKEIKLACQEITKEIHCETIPENAKLTLIKNIVNEFMDNIVYDENCIIIEDVRIYMSESGIIFEWYSSYKNDLLVNSLIRIIKDIGKNIESIKLSRLDKKSSFLKILRNYYVDVKEKDGEIIVTDNNEKIRIVNDTIEGNEILKGKVYEILKTVNLIFD